MAFIKGNCLLYLKIQQFFRFKFKCIGKIHNLSSVFQANKGDNQVAFEVMELETVKKQVELAPVAIEVDDIIMDEDGNIIEDENAIPVHRN